MILSTLQLLAAVALTVTDLAFADPRDVENDEFKEFDDVFKDEGASPTIGDLELHLTFDLEHQLEVDAPFTKRGVVDIVASASSPKAKISFSALPTLMGNDVVKLKKLLRDGRQYTVRAKADPSDPHSAYIMTSVPMCMLAAMRMREDFAFHLSDSGKLIAIEYLTPYLDTVMCAEYEIGSIEDVRFGPFGTVLKAQTGPSLPKNIVVKRDRAPQGVEPVKSEGDNDVAEEESQSFLRKYWYIILPIVVMSLFGGGGAVPAGEAGGAPATLAAGERRQ